MKSVPRVLLWIFLVSGVLAMPGFSQDLPPQMSPPLALAFPFQTVKGGVTVKYPVLLNPQPAGVVKPGTVLISIYCLEPKNGTPTDLDLVRHAEIENAYSRPVQSSSPTNLSHEEVEQINHAKNGQWTVPNNFILAMAQYSPELMHMICKNASDHYLDETFRFCDGMFLGLPGAHVAIISVQPDAIAAQAGLKAGDQIVAINGTPVTSLEGFSRAFASAKQDATDRHKDFYMVSVLSDHGQKEVKVTMPSLSLGGF
jgi:membrane-associated protease RseP (regulator of RpoE activity)